MRRFFLLFVTYAFVALLFSCGGTDIQKTNKEKQKNETKQAAPETEAPKDVSAKKANSIFDEKFPKKSRSGYKLANDAALDTVFNTDIISNIPRVKGAEIVGLCNAKAVGVFVVAYESGQVDFYEWFDFKKLFTYKCAKNITRIAVSSNARYLALLTNTSRVIVYDVKLQKEIFTPDFDDVADFSFHYKNEHFALARASNVTIYSLPSFSTLSEIKLDVTANIISVSFTPMPDPTIVGILYTNTLIEENPDNPGEMLKKTTYIFELRSTRDKKINRKYENEYNSAITDFKFLPTRPAVALAFKNGVVRFFSLTPKKLKLYKSMSFSQRELAFCFSPNGKQIAANVIFPDTKQVKIQTIAKEEVLREIDFAAPKPAKYFLFSPYSDAFLFPLEKQLRIINLSCKRFYIGEDKIDWSEAQPAGVAVPKPEITSFEHSEEKIQEAGVRKSVQKIVLTLYNEAAPLYRLKGAIKFLNAGSVVGKYPVYFGYVGANKTKTRTIFLNFPKDFIYGKPMLTIDLEDANGFVVPRRVLKLAGKVKPVAKLQLTWFYKDALGNINGIIEPEESGTLVVNIYSSGSLPASNIAISLRCGKTVGIEIVSALPDKQKIGKLLQGKVYSLQIEIKTTSQFALDKFEAFFDASFEFEANQNINKRKMRETLYFPAAKKRKRVKDLHAEVYVASDFAFITAAPSKIAKPVASVPLGTKLKITGITGEFYRIGNFSDNLGEEIPAFINKKYLTVSLSLLKKLGIEKPKDFAYEHIFQPQPLVVMKPLWAKSFETYVARVPLTFFLEAAEGIDNFRVSAYSKFICDKDAAELQQEDANATVAAGKLLSASTTLELKLLEGRTLVEISLTDKRGQKFDTKLEIFFKKLKGTLRILSVGVKEYQDLLIPSLVHAEDEASKIVEVFGEVNKKLLPSQKKFVTLLGKNATKDAIIRALKELSNVTRHGDLLIIYFAIHADYDSDNPKKYLLLPFDADSEKLEQTSISLSQLKKLLDDIITPYKIVIADCVNMIDTTKELIAGPDFSKLSSEDTSILIAADRKHRALYEKDERNLMSFYLLEGLKGKADTISGNNDGKVTLAELAAYVKKQIAEFCANQNVKQKPVSKISYSSYFLPLASKD